MALMNKFRQWNMPIKSHMASLDLDQMSQIQSMLEEEKGGRKKAKKVVKKKTATKKTAKKVASKKKTATKKVTKKTTISKPVTKKVTKKAAPVAAKPEEKEVTKKAVVRKKTVIRRKASEAEERLAAEAAAAAELEAAAAAAAAVATDAEDAVADPTLEVKAGTDSEAATPAAKVPPKHGRNIIGRIDLKKVIARTEERKTDSTRTTGTASAAPKFAGNRGIREGFVAPAAPVTISPEAARKKLAEERAKKKAGQKDQPAQNFVSTEFRKREVIFQPKRKRAAVIGNSKKTQLTTPKASKRIVTMHETQISVSEFADQMGVKVPALLKKLIQNGIMAKMNTEVDYETASLIGAEFGFEVQTLHITFEDRCREMIFGDKDAEPVKKAPVVTVMGHVDHGKTTLLDSIRKTNVVKGEAGGITQHIGAYQVEAKGEALTFIDTPGHAAFTEMRARGANVTDIAIIVVAADDGVMPQTAEAINHAKAAGVPIIIAVNKMDVQGANPEKITQQLTEFELVPEEWGGDTMFCQVSALKGDGVQELLDQVQLQAEVLELKANPALSGWGTIIEARQEKGRGSVCTFLIQDGTVKVGQSVVAGKCSGKIRTMTDDKGKRVKEMGPGAPVEITGFQDLPTAGERFYICENEALSSELAQLKITQTKNTETPNSGMSLESIFAKMTQGDLSELPIVLKSDVSGSIEAIKGSLEKIGNDEVKVKVIHSAVGGVTESDVLLAATAKALIIGFNVRPDSNAVRIASEKNIEVKCYKIIYELLDDLKKALSGLLKPDIKEEVLGQAEVREVFVVPKMGAIAGCMVTDGKIIRGSLLRLVRDSRVVYEGNMGSLRRFKDDAKEVAAGYECGIGIENYNDIKAGDVIEAYKEVEVARTLE
ncbi:MAG: translation initiation factor IF-2 [Bdellovibrionaceae bacterium]|nr:translation initiation factor IF-2 [Pseudobdellovibrionaceae bacterium]